MNHEPETTTEAAHADQGGHPCAWVHCAHLPILAQEIGVIAPGQRPPDSVRDAARLLGYAKPDEAEWSNINGLLLTLQCLRLGKDHGHARAKAFDPKTVFFALLGLHGDAWLLGDYVAQALGVEFGGLDIDTESFFGGAWLVFAPAQPNQPCPQPLTRNASKPRPRRRLRKGEWPGVWSGVSPDLGFVDQILP